MTSFVGREHELAQVAALLGARRLVTLTGPGGMGKTRLALAGRLRQLDAAVPFPDGAWFVDLAPLADPALVPDAVAQTLGVRETAGRPPEEALRDHLREQRLLLVLDNCEHLLPGVAPAGGRPAGGRPRGHGAGHQPRAPAGGGEREHPVPPLALPRPGAAGGPGAAPADPARSRSTRRWPCSSSGPRRSRPDFAVTNATAPAVVECATAWTGCPWRSSWRRRG